MWNLSFSTLCLFMCRPISPCVFFVWPVCPCAHQCDLHMCCCVWPVCPYAHQYDIPRAFLCGQCVLVHTSMISTCAVLFVWPVCPCAHQYGTSHVLFCVTSVSLCTPVWYSTCAVLCDQCVLVHTSMILHMCFFVWPVCPCAHQFDNNMCFFVGPVCPCAHQYDFHMCFFVGPVCPCAHQRVMPFV